MNDLHSACFSSLHWCIFVAGVQSVLDCLLCELKEHMKYAVKMVFHNRQRLVGLPEEVCVTRTHIGVVQEYYYIY
jgi:hypothetical protein